MSVCSPGHEMRLKLVLQIFVVCGMLFTLCNLETVVSTIDSPAHLFVIP